MYSKRCLFIYLFFLQFLDFEERNLSSSINKSYHISIMTKLYFYLINCLSNLVRYLSAMKAKSKITYLLEVETRNRSAFFNLSKKYRV